MADMGGPNFNCSLCKVSTKQRAARPSVNTRNEQSSESDVSDVKVLAWPSASKELTLNPVK